MANITLENNVFVYTNENEKRKLLDCNNYIANKSCIPMHAPVDSVTLPYFLSELNQLYSNLFVEGHAPNDGVDYTLIDILLAAQLIQTSLPVKVAELGCTNGRLSYHLASVIGRFNEKSTLCCVCDSIGNESGNSWLDMISLVGNAPKLSLIASDYDDTNLCGNSFDVVIINGSVQITDAYAIVKEALRLVKANGILICYAWNQPHITVSMKQAFSSVDEYPMSSNVSVLVANATDASNERDEIAEWKKEFQTDLALAEASLINCSDKKELLQLIQKLNQHADFASIHNIVDIKIKSIEWKEKLLIKYVEKG